MSADRRAKYRASMLAANNEHNIEVIDEVSIVVLGYPCSGRTKTWFKMKTGRLNMYHQPQIEGYMSYCISTTEDWTAPLQANQAIVYIC